MHCQPFALAHLWEKVSDHYKAQRSTEEAHYKSPVRDLPRLEPGQGVRVQDRKRNTVGVNVRAEATQRNYMAQVDVDVHIWRNRSHLRSRPTGGETGPGERPPHRAPMPSTRGR